MFPLHLKPSDLHGPFSQPSGSCSSPEAAWSMSRGFRWTGGGIVTPIDLKRVFHPKEERPLNIFENRLKMIRSIKGKHV